MNVKELIEKLSTLDPELEVMVYNRGMERSTYVKVAVHIINVVSHEKRCVDAFDYIPYITTVIRKAYSEDEKANSFKIVEIK